jgi:hypothetical protein
MELLPPLNVEIEKVATPLAFKGAVPRTVDPLEKVMGPVGDPVAPDKVAVKVTLTDGLDGLRLDCKATKVPFFTVCVSEVEMLGALLESPK